MKKHSPQSLSEVHESISTDKRKGWKRIFAYLGPAYLISVGYMDPGNWATDIAGGSQFGYKLIWVLVMSNLIALLLQSLSARLGIVGGMDLAQASKKAYPYWINLSLFVLAQTAIIACDLAEIIGMAIGLNLLFGLPMVWGIIVTALDTFLLLFLLKKGMQVMEIFILSLVSIIGISFVIEMLIVEPVYSDVLLGFIPTSMDSNALYISIGIIGATVMPHNLYLHSSLVQTRRIEKTTKGFKDAIKFNLIDTTIALNLAFFVNAAILILAAAAFYVNGFHEVVEIQDAHKLLNHIFGEAAPAFFAIALIAAGQSSTITGTLAGQIVMEGHLNLRIQPWMRRLLTRLLAIIPALVTILYFGDDALGDLLVLSQVVLSLQLGFAIIPLIHFTSDKKIMKDFVIPIWVKVLAWLSASIIVFLNIKLVIDEIIIWSHNEPELDSFIYFLVIPVALICLFLLIYVFVKPFLKSESLVLPSIPHGIAQPFTESEALSYKHIGIAIDFSGDEQKLIQSALKQGDKDSQFTFIHIVETAAAHYHGEEVRDLETISDEQNIAKCKEQLISLGYKANYKIEYGSPVKGILSVVENENIDFLVMRAHGHRGIKDLVFGSTVVKVRHKIKVPLLIIK